MTTTKTATTTYARSRCGHGRRPCPADYRYKHALAPRLQASADRLHRRRITQHISQSLEVRPSPKHVVDQNILLFDPRAMAQRLQATALMLAALIRQRPAERYLREIGVLLPMPMSSLGTNQHSGKSNPTKTTNAVMNSAVNNNNNNNNNNNSIAAQEQTHLDINLRLHPPSPPHPQPQPQPQPRPYQQSGGHSRSNHGSNLTSVDHMHNRHTPFVDSTPNPTNHPREVAEEAEEAEEVLSADWLLDIYDLADRIRRSHNSWESAVTALKSRLNVPPVLADVVARDVLDEMEAIEPVLRLPAHHTHTHTNANTNTSMNTNMNMNTNTNTNADADADANVDTNANHLRRFEDTDDNNNNHNALRLVQTTDAYAA